MSNLSASDEDGSQVRCWRMFKRHILERVEYISVQQGQLGKKTGHSFRELVQCQFLTKKFRPKGVKTGF